MHDPEGVGEYTVMANGYAGPDLIAAERRRRAEPKSKKWLYRVIISLVLFFLACFALFLIARMPVTHSSELSDESERLGAIEESLSQMDAKYHVLFERYEYLTEASSDGMRMEGGGLNFDVFLPFVVSEVKKEMGLTVGQSVSTVIAQVAPKPAEFQRTDGVALVDDLNNPGALVIGHYARKYYCTESYNARKHDYAICPTRAHGIAALIDLIRSHKGRTIRHYIAGGDGEKEDWQNYSGGNKDLAAYYFEVFSDSGIDLDSLIDGTEDQYYQLVLGHAKAEGSKLPISDVDFSAALEMQVYE